MYGRVYLIRNLRNGKVYVGQTTREIHVRWAQHCHDARRNRPHPLHAAIRKYGPAAFSVTLLVECDSREHLDREEQSSVAFHRGTERGYGYNVRAGGHGGGALSLETRRKLREANLGKPAHNKGKPMPEHQRLRMAEIRKTRPNPNLGKVCSPETRAKIGAANRVRKLGSKCSDATRSKMSEAQRRRQAALTPEQRKAIQAHRKGKPRSAADRAAMSAGRATPERLARRKRIIDLRDAGLKWDDVARFLGVTRATVIEIYQRNHVVAANG